MSARLEIRLFGGVRIRRGGTLLGGFVSAKAPALLAYLACNPGAHHREALAGLLWGELPEADARNNLRQTLSSLRKKVGEHLVITRAQVAFDFDAAYWLDVELFERWTREAGDLDALDEAIALYRGDFLAGFSPRSAPAFEEWMLAQRTRYREQVLWALQRLTDDRLHRRDLGRAMDAATRLLALDPWREEAYRQLMRALAYSGQRTAALAQFEKCRRVLDAELGVAPSLETIQLYERIRALGDRRIGNLSESAPPFFGREPELARIRAWAIGKEGRLLTIIGPGGVGKSRLALEAARSHAADFLEGVWLVPLSAVERSASLAGVVAATLGLPFTSGLPVETQLGHFLREKEMLLILDNMEHLLTGANLAWLTSLIAHSPDLKLLVTSRARLNLQAESVLVLGGLPSSLQEGSPLHSTSGDPHLGILQTPAGRLFLARARQVRPDFDGIGQEKALAELCRRVDGLPLAIELAASWIRAMELEDILAEVVRSLDFLQASWRDLPERHRSLQAVFDHSWRMLPPEEQEIYARLSAFGGGFTAQAAQAVAGASFHVLASLVDKSLLSLDAGRYTRHPMLRQFAEEKLQAHPSLCTDARRAHARHYARFIRQLEPFLFGGAVETVLRRVEPELKNLQRAWETGVDQHDLSVINGLSDGLAQIIEVFGLYQEGLTLARRAIEALEGCAAAPGQELALALGRAHGLAAVCYVRLSESEPARAHAQAGLDILAPWQPHLAYAHALIYAGAAAYSGGDLEQAAIYWQQAAEAYRTVGSVRGECVALNNVSEVMLSLERIDAARSHAARVYALAQEMQDSALMATTRQILAGVALWEGEIAAARAYAEEALHLHRRTGYRILVAHTLVVLARIAEEGEDRPQAVRRLQESIAIFRQLGAQAHLCSLLVDLGRLSMDLGRLDAAVTALHEARALAWRWGEAGLAEKAEALLAECSRP